MTCALQLGRRVTGEYAENVRHLQMLGFAVLLRWPAGGACSLLRSTCCVCPAVVAGVGLTPAQCVLQFSHSGDTCGIHGSGAGFDKVGLAHCLLIWAVQTPHPLYACPAG